MWNSPLHHHHHHQNTSSRSSQLPYFTFKLSLTRPFAHHSRRYEQFHHSNMDTAEGRSVTESSEQQIKNIQSRHEDTPPVSQVPEVQNPVEASSSVPAEGNTGKTAKKPFFKRTWSKATERLFRRNTGNEERRFFIHNVRQLPPAHQRGPSDLSGFVNLGRQDPRARDPKVKHPDSGPDHCVMCNKQLHDSTSDYHSWKRCETRVYLPCGHPFGHRCLHSYLKHRLVSRTPESDAIIVGGEQYCPMGNCIPIRYECDHLAIPTLQRPQPRYEDQEGQIIPSECGFCSSDPCVESRISHKEEYSKKMIASPLPRQYTYLPGRIVLVLERPSAPGTNGSSLGSVDCWMTNGLHLAQSSFRHARLADSHG